MTATPPCDGEIFARLKRWRRIWAVAAIHGEAEKLKRLLPEIEARLAPGDKVVFLGNYLGYGSDVGATLDLLIAFRRAFLGRPRNFLGDIVFLRGWQEETWQKLIQLQFASNPREVLQWMLDRGLGATLAAYGADPRQAEGATREGVMAITRWTATLRAALDARPGHRAFLNALKHAAIAEDNRLLFVHAGVDPGKPLELQGDVLWWGGADMLDLAEPFAGFGRIIGGFDRHHRGFVKAAYATSLDAGSGLGGPLVAACFDQDGEAVESFSA